MITELTLSPGDCFYWVHVSKPMLLNGWATEDYQWWPVDETYFSDRRMKAL